MANTLASLLEAGGIELRCIATAPCRSPVPTLIAEVGGRNHTVRWAAISAASLAPGETWSRGEAHDQLVRVTLQQPMPSMVAGPWRQRACVDHPWYVPRSHRVSQSDGPIARLWHAAVGTAIQHVPRLRPITGLQHWPRCATATAISTRRWRCGSSQR